MVSGRITQVAALSYFWNIRGSNRMRDTGDRCGNTAEFDLVISILWSRLGACPTEPDAARWQCA